VKGLEVSINRDAMNTMRPEDQPAMMVEPLYSKTD
jgi:hypothetical protein